MMEFAFTEEQQMIRDTAEAFLKEVSSSESVRQAMATDRGYNPEIWQRICQEMYWQAIHIPESYGGMGLGFVELVATLEQMGRYLLCSPFFSTVVLASNALLVAGTEQQKEQYLTKISEGTLTATLAYSGIQAANKGGEWGADTVTATVEKTDESYVLNGTYRYVVDGHTADLFIVAARTKESSGIEGISLFVVPASTEGVERVWLPTLDQTRKQAEIRFRSVHIPLNGLMAIEGQGWLSLERILGLANVALAAEQVGGAQQCLDMSVSYAKERTQFNRAIAGFQAIKHKAADMMTRVEVARSGVYYAACVAQEALFGGNLKKELNEAASIAKSYTSDAYFKNAGEAIQIHGGVGFTWEYDVHLYFKRAKASEHFLGSGTYHRELLAQQLLDGVLDSTTAE